MPVEVTDGVRPGVVSLPHGWGHDRAGTRLAVASARPGVNVNQLLDGTRIDPSPAPPCSTASPSRCRRCREPDAVLP